MNGLLIINKKQGCTSRDVVNTVSKKLGTKKVGHTGTLDPMATGVLVLCIGSATKLVDTITSNDKEYVAEVTLGLLTDTGDITGNVIEKQNVSVNKQEIKKVLKEMVGTYKQTVPIYSAIKINGKKLYEYARERKEVELPSRLVTIYSLDLISDIKKDDNKVIFKIKTKVSKGTYIRSLIEDIARLLNTIGTMSSLERTRQGIFDIKDAIYINDINEQTSLVNPLIYLSDYKQVIVNKDMYNQIKNGNLILNKDNDEVIVFKDNKERLLAIYITYNKNYFKPWKMFIRKEEEYELCD
ncbi:MAG: tRNA pseudouridine(55) synthase TruB [Bacilli bacterium]|nr:tRNA pseudouridine(55) synthase TruB [Bacilli bacterium]